MNVPIPPDFETFAREQVEAGVVASEEEAVAVALRDYLARRQELRTLVDDGLADLDRGDVTDGETFMRHLLAETRARAAARTG